MPLELLGRVPQLVAEHQQLFGATGAVHAAAIFDRSGKVRNVREDVGRHNAVDKVVGAMLLAGELPATGLGLFVSGRASVEMVQKAAAIGAPVIVAVSAPTALAVRTAEAASITLVAVARSDGFEIFTHPRRIADEKVAYGT